MSESTFTPLERKLGIKPNTKILLAGMDVALYRLFFEPALPNAINEPLTPDQLNFIHFFLYDSENLQEIINLGKENLTKDGQFWLSWPKKSSKLYKDLEENMIREAGLATGMVDVKVCSVSDDWSALKFVFRKKDR